MSDGTFDSATIVDQWLTAHGIEHTYDQPFEGLFGDHDYLRFDLWLPNHRICIEVDGQQHYQARFNDSIEEFLKKRDYGRRKERFCLKYGILLIRIVYDELPYLDKILGFLVPAERGQIETNV